MADAPSREPIAERARDFAEARRPFFEARLPEALRQPGPRGLLWWQWLALPALLVIALVAGALLGWLTRVILGHVVTRTRTRWDDRLLDRVTRPLTALWAVALVTALHPWLLLDDAAAGVLQRVLQAAAYLVLLWGGMRAVEVAFTAAAEAPASRASANLSGLLPVARKVSKVALVAIGLTAVWVLRELRDRPDFATGRVYRIWNMLGILDLVVAVGMGGLSAFLGIGISGPVTSFPMARMPLVLIPAFLVPLFVILHIVALVQSRRLAAAGGTCAWTGSHIQCGIGT